jgi:hypothetical protein
MFPPNITSEQIVSFGKAMLKGDPEGATVLAQSVKEVLAGVFHGTS